MNVSHQALPPVRLAFSADERMAAPLAVAVYSALRHLDPDAAAQVYVVDNGFTVRSKRRLQRMVGRVRPDARLQFLAPCEEKLARLPVRNQFFSPATYGRLQLPRLLPEADRVLYLDADILVTGDLAGLYRTDLEEALAAACQTPGIPTVSHPNGVKGWHTLGLPAEAPFFNTGVLLMDLEAWRRARVGERAERYIETGDLRNVGDQEALNALLVGRWKPLDPRWNVIHVHFLQDEVPEQPAVIHFTSIRKPWSPHCDHPLQGAFLRTLATSGFLSGTQLAHQFLKVYGGQAFLALKKNGWLQRQQERSLNQVSVEAEAPHVPATP